MTRVTFAYNAKEFFITELPNQIYLKCFPCTHIKIMQLSFQFSFEKLQKYILKNDGENP